MSALRYRDPGSGDWVDLSVPQHTHDDYLPVTGGVMTGPVGFSGQKVTGLGAPVAAGDVATKGYMDSVAPPVGAIVSYGGGAVPAGWHPCDGSAHGSAELLAVTGSPNAPDFRDRFIITAGASYAMHAAGGAAVHSLTEAEMPSHAHGVNDPGHDHEQYVTNWLDGNPFRRFDYKADATGMHYDQGARAGVVGTGISFNAAGGSQPHNNIPPYYALTYMIRKGAT